MVTTVDLQNSVRQQTNLLRDFLHLLQQENEILSAEPTDLELINIGTKKTDFANRIAQLDDERINAIQALGYADDKSGIRDLIADNPVLQGLFDELWSISEQAKNINNQNGQMLDVYISHNQKAIDTLHGLMGQNIYDASGKYKRK